MLQAKGNEYKIVEAKPGARNHFGGDIDNVKMSLKIIGL
jgi:hypothetical protein